MGLKIKLNTVNDAGLFAAKCGSYSYDIDYVCGRYIMDAKSLMGILSIGLGRVCEVEIHTDDSDVVRQFKEDIEIWRVRGDE